MKDVNKMGVREYDYIRGNTAVKPERRVEESQVNRELQRKRREQQKKLQQKKARKIKSLVSAATFIFVLGASNLAINGYVYSIQNKLSQLEMNVKEQMDINEALKVEMLKYASLDKIKTTAENDLSMVYPKEESTVAIDMSKEYFSHLKTKQENKASFIAKLMDTFN